ncbi:hypothetical protein OXYTRIMIC_244 [Oxytricha trifallax]|uniref:Helicase ATP-binding domain-containing protein n=1 Tax=Oxytricha trifallax TaxID=1172189 RepID=A0A073HZA0_9SPIT|nr:hypothetical protein OXYTRIMIC_244 [Oxytricha trifallax]
MLSCSQSLQESCLDYKHSIYQSTLAAIILNHHQNNIQVQMPTASGKTWVQGLLACYWIQQGKKVVIIVPDQILKLQTQKFLQPLGIQLQIETIENFYKQKKTYDIMIIDEFDHITWKYPYYYHEGKMYGVWDLGLTRSYMFSATCDQGILRVLAQVCIQPKVLKFKSEYEILNDLSQDQGGDIIVCANADERLQKIKKEIEECGHSVPLIIFCNGYDMDMVKGMVEQIGQLKVRVSISQTTLEEIQSWQNGVLILDKDESYGYNTRFRVDAQVLIACDIDSESQYLQMRGRSSRNMGALQSKYFPITILPKQQILHKMKQISIEKLDKLEQLVGLIYKKRFNKVLLEAVSDAKKENEVIASLEDLKQLIGTGAFQKLAQGIKP